MTKAELKQVFKTGQYPTEDHFAALIDMILTPTSEIEQKNVRGLLSALAGKYDKSKGENTEALVADLQNAISSEVARAQEAEALKANIADIANSLFKGTLYLNNNSDAIFKDAALTDIDNQHDADGAGIWIVRGNSVLGIMARGWNEATIYPHNAHYMIHWVWDTEQEQWVRAEIAKSYTITEVERNKWNKVINDLSTETTRAQNAESALQKNIDKEKARAQQAENALSQTIETVAESALETFATKEQLTVENKRAVGAEQTLQKNITTETTRAQNAESALQREIDVLKVGSIDTMQEGAQVVTDTTNGKYGLLLTSSSGSIDNWRQRLITFTGILERRWDRTIGNMGGNWSPIWTTVLEWDKITTEGADISNETLTLTGGNMVEDTTAIILQKATVYNNTLIL